MLDGGQDVVRGDGPESRNDFFTGKPIVPDLGRAFLMRNYSPGLGKWRSSDPLGFPDGWNAAAYCCNGVDAAVDLWGGATVLSICSNEQSADTSSGLFSGHSWIIVYDYDGIPKATYGTWGLENLRGLLTDQERDMKPESCRTAILSDYQAARMGKKIDEYKSKGVDAWSETEPCSDFAIAVWLAATGEDLSSGFIFTTPTELKKNIIEKNGGERCGLSTALE